MITVKYRSGKGEVRIKNMVISVPEDEARQLIASILKEACERGNLEANGNVLIRWKLSGATVFFDYTKKGKLEAITLYF